MHYIVLAIPVFFLLIAVELVASRLLERECYRLNDALNDLSCGIIEQLVGVLAKTAVFAGYVFVYRYRLFEIPDASPTAWVACFLGVDFLYYWFHRMSHEVNALWAAHVVHHQSEEYNLAVALRQSAFQSWFSWAFYLPLALLGFPPLLFLAASSFNTLYQFWIHTRLIGRLGPLDAVLNTPSNHRVHHGRNPKYIDRNHGGTLIVWDRLFGTYAAEQDEPAYGITTPLRSWNPVWANLHYWVDLAGKARRATRLRDRLRLFLARPGWQPAELGGHQPAREVEPGYRKFDPELPLGLALYVLIQFALVLLASAGFLFFEARVPASRHPAIVAALVVSLAALGGLMERKAWALALELARLGALLAAVAFSARLGRPGSELVAATAAAALLSAAWLLWFRGAFAPRPEAEAS